MLCGMLGCGTPTADAAPDQLQVCTYNMGLHAYRIGHPANMDADGTRHRLFAGSDELRDSIAHLQQFFNRDYDVLCLQENYPFLDDGSTVSSANELIYPLFSKQSDWSGEDWPLHYYAPSGQSLKVIVTKYPQSEQSAHDFESQYYGPGIEEGTNKQGWIQCTIVPNGKRIVIVNTHLNAYGNEEGTACRMSQLAQLADSLAGEENVILCGDFNACVREGSDVKNQWVFTPDLYDTLTENGYTLLNGGGASYETTLFLLLQRADDPDNPTGQARYIDVSDRLLPIDNIAIKGDLTGFAGVWYEDAENRLSDHYPFAATIKLPGD